MIRAFSLLLIICPSTGLAGEPADRSVPATEHIDTVNYVLGTQTFGVKYKISEAIRARHPKLAGSVPAAPRFGRLRSIGTRACRETCPASRW